MNQSIARHQDSDIFGLLYGFRFRADEPGREIDAAAAMEFLRNPAEPEEFLWLHLNLAHASCERLLKTNLELPDEVLEALHEGSRSPRIERVD